MESPYAILGVPPGAPAHEVAAAYRALAKRAHPDAVPEDAETATARMAQINAAYDALRSVRGEAPAAGEPEPSRFVRRAGSWLPPALRRALGSELLSALEDREQVELVAPMTTWASPGALLAVTDRRLLWLLDDAVTNRVHWLRFRDVLEIDSQLSWPLRRRATVRVRARDGRRHEFAHLVPAHAARVVRAAAAGGPARR